MKKRTFNAESEDYSKRLKPAAGKERYCHRFAKFGRCKFNDKCAFIHCNDRAELVKAGYEAPPEEYFNRARNEEYGYPSRSKGNNNSDQIMTMLSTVAESLQKVAENFKGAAGPTVTPVTSVVASTSKKNHPLVHFADDSTVQTAFLAAMEAASKTAFKLDQTKEGN